jgi:hypothetical protein
MRKRDGRPDVADEAPCEDELTPYDRAHFTTYLRLLDAESDGADWTEAALIVLGIDPGREPARAWRARTCETHMARARWMTEHGYEQLLRAAYH